MPDATPRSASPLTVDAALISSLDSFDDRLFEQFRALFRALRSSIDVFSSHGLRPQRVVARNSLLRIAAEYDEHLARYVVCEAQVSDDHEPPPGGRAVQIRRSETLEGAPCVQEPADREIVFSKTRSIFSGNETGAIPGNLAVARSAPFLPILLESNTSLRPGLHSLSHRSCREQ